MTSTRDRLLRRIAESTIGMETITWISTNNGEIWVRYPNQHLPGYKETHEKREEYLKNGVNPAYPLPKHPDYKPNPHNYPILIEHTTTHYTVKTPAGETEYYHTYKEAHERSMDMAEEHLYNHFFNVILQHTLKELAKESDICE